MLLSTLIVVLQEILEAALIISLLLVICRLRGASGRWVWPAAIAGAVGAALYASLIEEVSLLFDYTGQEITNAALQLGIYLCLAASALLMGCGTERRERLLRLTMTLAVSLAVVREGFEILLYQSGLMASPELVTPLLVGATLATGIGASIGALFYYGILSVPAAPRRTLTLGLIALFGGNMLSQAALMLIQSDWLPGGAILWDSSALLPEDSLAGQLFYALVGYEATPSLTQAIAYFGGFTLLAGLAAAATRRGDNPFTQDHRP